jgi:carboxyl-terminal processing protease
MVRSFVATLLLLLTAAPLFAQDEPKGAVADAEKTLTRIAQRPEKAWDYAFALRRLAMGDEGAKVSAVFERGLDNENEWVQLVCARLVCAKGNADTAYETIGKLLQSKDSAIVESAAMLLSDQATDDAELVAKLRSAWKNSAKLSAGARVELCEALFLCTGDKLAQDSLKEFLLSSDHDVKARAALALADLGDAVTSQGRLEQLAKEPGQLGRLARISKGIFDIRGKIDEIKTGVKARKEPLIAMEVRALRANYVDDKFDYKNETMPLTAENLIDQCCRAMTSYIDDFSDFLTPMEIKKMQEDQNGRYYGIGAFVGKNIDEDYIRITQPMYNGPAYGAGMRSGDMLVGVNDASGKRVDLKGAEVDDAVSYIKGPLNSTVVVYVKRRGVEKELVFEVKRQEIEVDTALDEMLPGGVGYIRLTRFGGNSTDDMKRALANLQKQGMKSLVLDLRDNPGGQLTAVLDIADLFMKPGTLISTAGGIFGQWKGRQRYETDEPKKDSAGNPEPRYYDVPMVVMINENSASGSEMLSGTLKDNGRATIVGQGSYGKGIGQSFFQIRSSDRILKCTVFSYYLPSGITIDRVAGVGGVSPHVKAEAEYLEPWEVYARDHVLKSDTFEQYLDTWYRGETKEKLMKLAVFDARDAAQWPEFDKFYATLGTQLSKEDVRRELRFKLRVRVADDRAAEFTQNYQEDKQLLVGLVELFKKSGGDISKVNEYAAVLGK